MLPGSIAATDNTRTTRPPAGARHGARQEGQPRKSASAFADFVGYEDGRTIMKRYGFLLPGESLAR